MPTRPQLGGGPIGAGPVGAYFDGPATTSTPFPADDDGWWAGAARCFVSVALATAAASLATNVAIAQSFDSNDELPVQAATTLGAGPGALPTQRAQVETDFRYWWATDEIPPQPAALRDDGYWLPPVPAPVAPVLQGPRWDDQVLFWRIDEQYALELWRPATPQAAPAFSSDDLFAPQAAPVVEDEDYWWQPPRSQVPPVVTVFQSDDERPTPPAPIAYEEDEPRFIRSADSSTFILWATTDEIVPQPASLSVDEAYWWRAQFLPAPTWAWAFQADDEIVPQPQSGAGGAGLPFYGARAEVLPSFDYWFQPDILPPTAAPAGPTEDYWQAPAPTFAQPAALLLWPTDDFAPRPPVLAEDDPPVLPRSSDNATFILWATNEEIVPQGQAVPDDYWLAPQPPLVPAVVRIWEQQDERATPPTPLAADEDYHLTFPRPPAPLFQAFSADDEVVPPAPPPPPVTPPAYGGGGGGRYHDSYWEPRRKSTRDFIEELFERVESASEEVVEEALEVIERAPSPEAVAQLVHVLLPNLEPTEADLAAARLSEVRKALEARLLELEEEEAAIITQLLFD